jgi:hypothetical protein
MNISRRALLATVSLLPLAACGGTASSVLTSLPQWATDAQNLAAAIAAYAGTLPGTVGTTISGFVTQLSAIAAQLVAAASAPASSGLSTLISSFGSVFNSIVGGVGSSLSGLGTFGTILQAGLQLLPTILSIAGIALAAAPDPRAIAAARAYIAAMAGK